jgi:hypothetical protein
MLSYLTEEKRCFHQRYNASYLSHLLDQCCLMDQRYGDSQNVSPSREYICNFVKKILGVKLCASNAGVYGELGRYPLYINIFVRMIKFWIKVINSQNCIIRAVYNVSKYDVEKKGCLNWVYNVRDRLCTTGLGMCGKTPM